MQIENGIGDRVDIDGVEELDGLPHEVGLTDQQVELCPEVLHSGFHS